MKPLRFTVIGLGGFGLVHLEAVKWLEKLGEGTLTGIVALAADRDKRPELVETYTKAGVRFFDNVDHFFEQGVETTDVLTVPVGIHQHVPLSIRAMQAGLDVYCEKPVAATVQEADKLIEAQRETGRSLAIGYQHMYSHSITGIKKRIVDGRLGQPLSCKLRCGWPRSAQYFSRNNWTGKLRIDCNWILDSIANNACAHYVLNMLYLSTQKEDMAASVDTVQAELYRAYDIESADTVALRYKTTDDVPGYIFLTHTNRHENGPVMHINCERGTVFWQANNGFTYILYDDGKAEQFDNLVNPQWMFEGFRDLATAILDGRPPLCTPELAKQQTVLINAMHESCPSIKAIPASFIEEAEDWEMFPPDTKGHFRRVEHLDEYMHIAFQEELLPSEMDIPWAVKSSTEVMSLKEYNFFPQKNIDLF